MTYAYHGTKDIHNVLKNGVYPGTSFGGGKYVKTKKEHAGAVVFLTSSRKEAMDWGTVRGGGYVMVRVAPDHIGWIPEPDWPYTNRTWFTRGYIPPLDIVEAWASHWNPKTDNWEFRRIK
jgi:hypothetical protein